MSRCPACSDPVDDAHRFCPSCGAGLDVSEGPTGTAPRRPTPPAGERATPRGERAGGSARRVTPSRTGAAGVSGTAEGRFPPGTVVCERYLVVGLLGKGGQGEVYRADDLTLEQPVALKFLPAGLESDPERRERFYNEVRIARQISHPAVCRVYDVGEVDGRQFLSMEYVDGENVASLMRRIGRLAPDKALEIARQLCAGLAAAHAKGVLHRDLKPENVMLDGDGKVRITDFGLSGLVGSFGGDDVRSGTPAYMSPEQLEGKEVTVRSDVYSLGLVLYELFTGKRAFEGRTLAELVRQHRDEAPRDPSRLVPGLDPAIERAILLCLEKDPRRRPPSAVAVSVMLGGGDALAAALAAGQTPSPELVAAAGEAEGLRPGQAWTAMALIVGSIVLAPIVARRQQLIDLVPVEKSPAALEDRARDLLGRLGRDGAATDQGVGFAIDEDYFRWTATRDKSPRRWDELATGEPPVLWFWYRESPRPLVSTSASGRVSWTDPPALMSGMAGARFDARGRLLAFYRVPPQVETDSNAVPAPDWSLLLKESHLDAARLRPAEPRWTPPFFCDTGAAWEGVYADRPEIPIRVEAAAYRGRPVFFHVTAPWTRPDRMEPYRLTSRDRVRVALFVGLFLLLMAAGGWLARRNFRLGRGDRRGAFRIGAFLFAANMLAWALDADHVLDLEEFDMEGRAAGMALLLSAIVWLFYLALEPYVRRLRPRTLISWTRLFSGSLRDGAVGRDVLVGAAWGALLGLVMRLCQMLPRWLGQPAEGPWISFLDVLLGPRRLWASVLRMPIEATLLGMGSLLLFLLLKLILRKDRLATAALVLILSAVQSSEMNLTLWLALSLGLVIMGSYSFVLLRFGLLSAVAGVYVVKLLLNLPLTTDVGGWMGAPTVLGLLAVAALGVYALRTSVRGPLFGRPLLDD